MELPSFPKSFKISITLLAASQYLLLHGLSDTHREGQAVLHLKSDSYISDKKNLPPCDFKLALIATC